MRDFIASVKTISKDDSAEDVVGGYYNALYNLSWTPKNHKLIVHFADYAGHGRGWNSGVDDKYANTNLILKIQCRPENMDAYVKDMIEKSVYLILVQLGPPKNTGDVVLHKKFDGMKIFCKLGDSVFPVDAEPTTTIGDLKKMIKKEKEHDLSEIDPDKLHLVHVFETPSKNEDGGVPVVGVQDDTDLVEVERAVLSKRSSGVDVEKVRKTEDGIQVYKVPGWQIKGPTISAKVMNPGGACSDYGLERDSAKFTIDILVILPG
ncbi:hypothetical protein HK098_007912, partial [Nowakowskiella sp. JEL0407]